MTQSLVHVFLQDRPSDPARRWKAIAQDNEPPDDFWPEVSVRCSPQDDPAPVKPENAQGRVLLEVLLILAAITVLAFAVTMLLPPMK